MQSVRPQSSIEDSLSSLDEISKGAITARLFEGKVDGAEAGLVSGDKAADD